MSEEHDEYGESERYELKDLFEGGERMGPAKILGVLVLVVLLALALAFPMLF